MGNARDLQFIQELIKKTNELIYNDLNEKDSIIKETELLIRRLFSEPSSSEYKASLRNIAFRPFSVTGKTSITADLKAWENGKAKLLNLQHTMQKDLEWFDDEKREIESDPDNLQTYNKVFIVHGHDEAMKSEVARIIEKLNLEAVILHEQEDKGFTVIEKFEENANQCNFAVVLLSPDDRGHSVQDSPDQSKLRARQNVILELGYFVGKLGRSKVLSLVKKAPSEDLEIPSDFAGVIYTPYDVSGGWKMPLIKALKSAGYDIDANVLI